MLTAIIVAAISILVVVSNLVVVYLIRRKSAEKQKVTVNRDADLPFAMRRVWVDLFGLSIDLAPRIIFVGGSALDCSDGKGWKSSQGCVAGLSWQESNACGVAWPEGTTKLSQTSFGHELRHAKAWHTGENSDHDTPEFQADVVKINDALRAAGQ